MSTSYLNASEVQLFIWKEASAEHFARTLCRDKSRCTEDTQQPELKAEQGDLQGQQPASAHLGATCSFSQPCA